MKKLTGYFIKHRILFALYTFFAFINIQNTVSQSLVVDGIDLMEGFTFGAAAEDINTAGYNVWTVTNTDDQVFDVVPGSLRWAIEQINKDEYKAQDNYIHFDIPGSGPHVITLFQDLPVINGNVIIDGGVVPGNEPSIVIDGDGVCEYDFYINNHNTNSSFQIQGFLIKNFLRKNFFAVNCNSLKIYSNIIYNEQSIDKHSYVRVFNPFSCILKGNIIGTNLSLDTNYNHTLWYGFNVDDIFHPFKDINYVIGGDDIDDRNVFANTKLGAIVGHFYKGISINNNLFYNIRETENNYGSLFLDDSYPVSISKNLFYQCTNAIDIRSSNPDAHIPLIETIEFSEDDLIIKGTTKNNRSGETIEVFLGTSENDQDAIKYLGNAVSDANGEWELSGNSSDWADPSFTLREGDIILATSTYDGQTSEFSDTAMIPCMQANLVITDPATACETDLTLPAIIKGSTGGNDLLIPHSGLVTEDPSNSTDHFTDMDWWGSEDGTPAINDNDETTSWRARPRNSKTNYFIIDMQAIHDISKIEVICGDETFSDGVCEVYIADWRDNSGDYKIQDLSWTKVTEFRSANPNTTQTIHFNGEIARFIKFQLTTNIDKDYWKINEVNIYKHQFSYYQDADAAIPLTEPEHITTSGTYYIKMGDGACTDIKPVQVIIDPMLCTGCPCNININNPEPACFVDLTSASITAGTKGGSNGIIDNQGFVTENHTNSENIYTDMTWWDEEGHPEAMTDNDLETYWHARPRANQANYFIINMQEVHEISRIEIFSGDHVFNEGVCEIYTAYWDSPPYTIKTLEWKKKGQFGPVSKNATKTIDFRGDSAQFIKFRLTTSIDKDYWDIRQVNIFRHAFTVWEDAAATTPLATPENVTTSGTYYIKSGDGSCADIQPVDVTIDPDLCNPSCNLVVKDPDPADDYVDLTDPALREGTSGNGYGMTDNSSYTCPNNMSDLDWWDDADGLQAMLDNDPNTYFHAQARSSNTNYFTIDMQAEYSVGEIDITSGWNVFDEGTCSVYLSKDNTNWTKAAEFGPIQINATQNIKIHGIEARYIKFELNTSIDKDYWDITGINIYQHEYSYWKDEALTEPLEQPANVTQSGTYYVKLKAGTCEDSDFVEVKLNNCNQFIPPTIVSDKPTLHYIPCQDGYTNDPATLSLTEAYDQYAWYKDTSNLDSGLIAYYPFNANAVDETGNGHDGTVNGSVLTTDRFGNPNSAYDFDGVDDYIELNDNKIIITQMPFSISIWAKIEEYTDANYIFCQRDKETSHGSSFIGLLTDNTYSNTSRFGLRNSGSEQLVKFEGPVCEKEEWHLYTATVDESGNVKFYIDNQIETTGIYNYENSFFDNIDMVAIGAAIRDGLANYYFNGMIDDVRIYNRALIENEIQSLYTQNGWHGPNVNLKDGLAAYYPFNGNANDESGNGNDGAVDGAILTTDRFGNTNKAYHFDGDDDFIQVPAHSSINNIWDDGGTIAFWLYLDSKEDWDRYFAKDQSNGMSGGFWSIHLHDVGNYLQLEDHFSNYKGEWYTNQFSPDLGEWIHLAVVYDASSTTNDVLFYVNGQLENTIERRTPSGTRPDDSLKDLFIGGDNGQGVEHFFNGKMDDIWIYNRILNADEIQALYGQASTNPKDIISNDPSLQVSEPGTYYVDVIDANGCTGISEIIITEQKEPGYEDIYAVTNTNNIGKGSLRNAIIDINTSENGGEIIFCIPGEAPHTINLTSELPPVTKPIQMDGNTQPRNGYQGNDYLINISSSGFSGELLQINCDSGTTLQNIVFESEGEGIALSSGYAQIHHCHIHGQTPLLIHGYFNQVFDNVLYVNDNVQNSKAIIISGSNNTIGGHDNTNKIRNYNATANGIIVQPAGQQNHLSENEFLMHIECPTDSVHRLMGNANNNMEPPEITYINFYNGNIEIEGTSVYNSDVIEIYAVEETVAGNIQYKYVASVTSLNNTWHTTIHDFDYSGQLFSATSTLNNNTSEFSTVKEASSEIISGPNQLCLGESAAFSTTLNPADIDNYTWDMGDGTTYSEPGITHTYADSGVYTVTLTVEFNSGETEEFKKDITVLLTPDLYVNITTNAPEEQTITLNATQDTYVSQRNAGTNYGSDENLFVENREVPVWGFFFNEQKRALIKFEDLSFTLPSNIEILNATMTLSGNGHRSGNNGIIARVINSWDESNTDWNNQPEYTLTNKKVLSPPNSMDQDYTIDITDFAEKWYDNVETNHGVIIYFPESVRYEQRFRFYSRETDDEANKPRLEITYRFNTPTVCEGEQVSVNVSGADAYSWQPNDYLSCTDCHNPVIIPYDTSGYQVVGLNANGCTDTAEFTINTLPAPVADAGPDLGICPGTSVILNANEGDGLSYAWSPADGLSCNDCRTPTASPDQTTMYTLNVSNAAGCSATDQVLITMPSPAIYDCFDHAMMLDMNGQDYWCSNAAIYTNEDATPDHAKPSCMTGGPVANKWFKFTATTRTIKIILSTGNGKGTLRNPYLTLWNQNGAELACEQYTNPDDDLYLIYDRLQPGRTYYFSVDSDNETRGTFSLCLSNGRDNDFFQFATEIANPDNWCAGKANWKQDYTTVGATRDIRGSSCMRRPQYNKWFKFKAIGNRVTVSASPEGDNPIQAAVIALWDNRRREVDCHSAGPNGTARLKDILVTPGEWYYVSVDNRGRRTNTGRFDLCINSYYDYDYAEGAKIIDNAQVWCSELEAYTTVEATPDKEAGSCWDNGPNNNRWFKFVAVSEYAEITLKTNNETGTISRAYIALWDDDYTEISCSKQNNPTQDEITITANNLTPGEWYYISVDNYSRFSLPFFPPSRFAGTFSLCVQSDFDGDIFYSIADGDWDDNIWSFDKYATVGNGQTPGTDDMVIIYDHTVTLRHDATISKALISVENRDTWLIMQGGNLNIENGLQIIKNCP